MIYISSNIQLGDHEVEFSAIHASGPGGQNVNKSNTAVQLRFDIGNSSLPREVKHRLMSRPDHRISKDGVIVIKAQEERSQARNREAAVDRLKTIIRGALRKPKKRIPTRPPKKSLDERLAGKKHRSLVKSLRKPIRHE